MKNDRDGCVGALAQLRGRYVVPGACPCCIWLQAALALSPVQGMELHAPTQRCGRQGWKQPAKPGDQGGGFHKKLPLV